MDNYLRRYVGTYRVKAHYDTETNDYPRTIDGTLDESFGDFYIDCANHIEIKHGTGSTLACYIPSVGRGRNLLRTIYSDKINTNEQDIKDIDKVAKKLVSMNILKEIDMTDAEVYFEFSADMIGYIAKLVKAKTAGANISPLSSKNLPKSKSVITPIAAKEYTDVMTSCDLEKMEKAALIRNVNKSFAKKLPKNYKEEMKKLRYKFKDYVFYKGLWKEYIDAIKKEV